MPIQRIAVQTSSRLHFGLLSWGDRSPRQFGGVGLMVRDPGLAIAAEPAPAWGAAGPLADRVLAAADRVAARLAAAGSAVGPLRFAVAAAPPEHVGLGVGTQVGMAVARIVAGFAGHAEPAAPELAALAGRGLRSGIGLHGFALGGLIVDGGRGRGEHAPTAPLLARLDFPAAWSVLVAIPPDATGLHGPREVQAFRQIPAPAEATVDRLARLVLLDLLPAVHERDLAAFGAALAEIQLRIGEGFAPAQGGTFARPDLEDLAASLRAEGLVGVGQSSWGPTIYGFAEAGDDRRSAIARRILARTGWPATAVRWTRASPAGARVDRS